MRSLTVTCVMAAALMMGCSSGAQSLPRSADAVQFLGLKEFYAPGERISFQAKSNASSPQQFTCGVEQRIDGEWREVVLSVFATDPTKAARLVQLDPHASVPIDWDPAHDKAGAPIGEYRFRIDLYGESKLEPVASAYSSSFNLQRN